MTKSAQSVGRLFLLAMDQSVREILPDEFGKLKYGVPEFDYMKRVLIEDIVKHTRHKCERFLIEHVSVYWQTQRCHMFVDEDARVMRSDMALNERATRIYMNATYYRQNLNMLLYDELSEDPKFTKASPPGNHFPFHLLDDFILGPALLWTGDME